MRKILAAGALGTGLLALASCGSIPPFACAAVGYSSVAFIQLDVPAPDLHLELCSGADCMPGPVEMPVEVGSTAPSVATGIFGLEGDSEAGWSATLLNSPPEMGFRVIDAAGTTIAQGAVEVEWVRIDGTEQCGGNHEADIVIPL
ncbi:hypothetical protein [Microbacterium timonense]|uniref:hypothetical protein n=1 Tax=Microbacterium timonense TaxID=2086576 RepID=UPI000D10D0F9|nr:hypothetical protein [Microbacterium timonense]